MSISEVWDRRFIELAQLVATWSKDPRTKVGCAIVNNLRIPIGLGYNGFPRGVDDDLERYEDSTTKYKYIVHAEANAILNVNGSPRGCTIYTMKFPCTECAKLILQSGIYRVVYPYIDREDPSFKRWADDAKIAWTMLKEAGIVLTELTSL